MSEHSDNDGRVTLVAPRFVCNNGRCRFVHTTPDGDCSDGQVCEACRAGKMRYDGLVTAGGAQ